jgi:uncharacterized RDD family membrane protein YckC
MRCPKCRYITFDGGDRCRNCGYEFSLVQEETLLDLPIQQEDAPVGPLADLQLSESHGDRRLASSFGMTAAPPIRDERSIALASRTTHDVDLPLFDKGDDAPLVTPAVPRPPLAVRRGAPTISRPRTPSAERSMEPALDLGVPAGETSGQSNRLVVKHGAPVIMPAPEVTPASAGARLSATALDALILGSIDSAVVYFTLQLCGLQLSETRMLPLVPLTAFLLLLAGGYATMFTTAGGQTIGKMAARIRVVPAHDPVHGRVSFGVSVVRSAAYLVSLAPAGLGFILALFSADGRALHDKLADTRVVKA